MECAGRYERVAKLGAGGMGEVWKARDRELGRWVALKFLHHEDGDERVRFRREAMAAARLSHPNIAAVYDTGEMDGRPYIAMQFIDGRTLAAMKRPSHRSSAAMIRDAASAVHAAHELGIVHRDLKPANLMVDRDGRVFVTDFGLAKVAVTASSLSASGTMIGTPAYMPPEQARGEIRAIDARSDVYALGATLYELLTGRAPFIDENLYNLLLQVESMDPTPPRQLEACVSADLETIVLKCLEKNPRRRYATARELAEDLTRWLDGEPIAAHPPSRWYGVRKRLAKRRSVVVAGTVGMLVAAAVAVAVVPRWRAERSARRELDERRDRAERARPHCESGRRVLEHVRRLGRGRLEFVARARAEFEKALAEDPSCAEAWLGIGRAEALAGSRDRALAALGRAVDASPLFAPAYLERVRLRIGEYEWLRHDGAGTVRAETDAAAGLRRSLESDLEQVERCASGNLERWYGRGMLAFAGGDYARAEAELARYLDVAPVDGDALAWRAHALYHLNRHREALEVLDRAVELDPHFEPVYFNRGIVRSALGDHAGSVDDYTTAIRLVPENAPAYGNRGSARMKLGDRAGARSDYTRAIALGARSAWLGRAYVMLESGDAAAAEADASRAIELGTTDRSAWFTRANARERLGNLRGAVDDFTCAIEIDPAWVEAYVNRGSARDRLGDFDGALADYARALAIAPDTKDAYYNRANARGKRGDLDGAIADATRAIELDPRDPDPPTVRGNCRWGKGDRAGAVADFTLSLRILPDGLAPLVNRGNVWLEMGDKVAAAADFERALSVAPADWPERAWIEKQLREARR
jgi:tetratricopeptide (TPR) repeat protein/predicted Ser/Thr protein kinase